MKSKTILCLVLVLCGGLLGCSTTAPKPMAAGDGSETVNGLHGQESALDMKSLSEKLERSLNTEVSTGESPGAKGVARKLEFNQIDSEHRQITQKWRVGQQSALIYVHVLDKEEKASAEVQHCVQLIMGGQKLPSFADEAYISVSPKTRACSLLFRKGRLFLSVGSSSEKMARQFAGYLLKSLP